MEQKEMPTRELVRMIAGIVLVIFGLFGVFPGGPWKIDNIILGVILWLSLTIIFVFVGVFVAFPNEIKNLFVRLWNRLQRIRIKASDVFGLLLVVLGFAVGYCGLVGLWPWPINQSNILNDLVWLALSAAPAYVGAELIFHNREFET